MKQLYKKDSKGKVRIWKIWTEGPELKQEAGILDGKLVPNVKTCKGKNIGKSNETTPEAQAVSEMNSKITEQLSTGYFENIDDVGTESEKKLLPMLAKDYKKHSKKVDWKNQVYVQSKLDGMRCLAFKEGNKVILQSRDGKMIENMDHIKSALSDLKQGVVLDGELYCHGLSFQENMKLIKKYREDESEKISFHIYDVVEPEKPFWLRFVNVSLEIYFDESPKSKSLVRVDTTEIISEDMLKNLHQVNLNNGYEGSIVRHGSDGYKIDARAEQLLKYKDFIDEIFEIVDIVPAEQRPEWGVPVLQGKYGTFRSGTKMSHEDKIDLLTNKDNYIGKNAEIRFFEFTDDGIPRFPQMVGIRLDR